MEIINKLRIWWNTEVAGTMSKCCYAETYQVPGWNQIYCSSCDKRIDNN